MKPNVKYPSPTKKSSHNYYRSLCNQNTKNSSTISKLFIFIGFVMFSYGLYNIFHSLFIQNSVQGVFHGILIALSGAIVAYISSHDRFVAKKQIKQES
ncbi:MAG: hypothetical protein KC646_09810 [Candidatus Cloacimonetes bacterium]|nr:hypothetical protein [Candidatus Cloacimonadota bacterium]